LSGFIIVLPSFYNNFYTIILNQSSIA